MMPPAILSDVRPGMSINADGRCGATAAYAPVNYMYRVVTLVCIPTRRPRAAVPAARRESAAVIYSEYQYSSAQVEQLPGCGSSYGPMY